MDYTENDRKLDLEFLLCKSVTQTQQNKKKKKLYKSQQQDNENGIKA